MARRIVVTVLALIVALLGLIAVPLGLITAGQDRADFRQEATAAAATLANTAEERLGDASTGPALRDSIRQLAHGGDQVSVYDGAGSRVTGTADRPPVPPGSLSRALDGSLTTVYPADDRILILAPVTKDGGGRTGAVALSRSTAPLDRRVTALWSMIGGLSAAGLVAAGLTAAALARWVSRPLSRLDLAARKLGGGALDARSPASTGPTEIRRLAANINTMAARLEALVHGHQAMMADVSHQLRTPLTALRLRLDVLAQDASDPVSGELAGAQVEIARLSRMVDGLLAVARAENTIALPVAVAVDAVISDRVAAWGPAAEERGIVLEAQGRQRVTAMLGEGHLEQILDNLLANALDSVPAGGQVLVKAVVLGSRVRVIVADNGPGMSRQRQRAAFRRFAAATAGGTGLGLAIVHRLATSDGGAAELSDTPGGGLTVTVDLPAAPRDRRSLRPGGLSS